MSYTVHIYKKEVKDKAINNLSFLEDEKNLPEFSEEQQEKFRIRLSKYNYILASSFLYLEEYNNSENKGISAILTNSSLYFTTTNNDSVFEILMTASEFIDSGEFTIYNLQTDDWEI